MAKLAIFVVLFVVLIVAANATTYTTTVTTTVADEENPHQQQCQKEIKHKSMNQCRMWMMEGRGRQFLRSMVENPQLEECCDEMNMINPMCRCDAIRKMMMDSQRQMGTQEMEKMMRKAESIPMMCRLDMPTECRMREALF